MQTLRRCTRSCRPNERNHPFRSSSRDAASSRSSVYSPLPLSTTSSSSTLTDTRVLTVPSGYAVQATFSPAGNSISSAINSHTFIVLLLVRRSPKARIETFACGSSVALALRSVTKNPNAPIPPSERHAPAAERPVPRPNDRRQHRLLWIVAIAPVRNPPAHVRQVSVYHAARKPRPGSCSCQTSRDTYGCAPDCAQAGHSEAL